MVNDPDTYIYDLSNSHIFLANYKMIAEQLMSITIISLGDSYICLSLKYHAN